MNTENLNLVYTLLCDDVRLEMGNKVSLMGVFQNIMVEKLPVSLIKFAVVNHWRGEGFHQTEVRIVSPDKKNLVVTSQPTPIELSPGGFTDNVSFFVNVVFSTARNLLGADSGGSGIIRGISAHHHRCQNGFGKYAGGRNFGNHKLKAEIFKTKNAECSKYCYSAFFIILMIYLNSLSAIPKSKQDDKPPRR